jgi:hypothetical protein
MDEQQLRELAEELRRELPHVIEDEEERSRAASEIEDALALPPGQAKAPLLAVLRARPETRAWAATRMRVDAADLYRALTGLPGGPTGPLGVHFICPACDYDTYLDSPTDDPGRCPHDGRKLVRAGD